MSSDWQSSILQNDLATQWLLFYERVKRLNPSLSEEKVKDFCVRLFTERGGECPISME